MSTVDLAPTLLDAAGLAVPPAMAGNPVGRLLRARAAAGWPEEVFVQISETQTGRAVRTHRWKYSVRRPAELEPVEASAGSDVYADEFLYDLEADPWELTNLIGLPPYREIVADMRARLVRRMGGIGEPIPRFIDALCQPSGQRQISYPGYQAGKR